MGTPFMSEIKICAFNFAPQGWAFCNGQFLPINQNQALFSLLGTTYGGDGRVTFALPDFRGRIPIHVGQGWLEGQKSGEESHTVNTSEMPAHNHMVQASGAAANKAVPTNTFLANVSTKVYAGNANVTTLHPTTITNV